MSRSFIDTNVIAYAADDRDPAKRATARAVLATREDQLVVSTQVLSEFYVVATKKLGISSVDAAGLVQGLTELEVVVHTSELVLRAIGTSESTHVSFWDALIIEAAAHAGCDTLVTEDLQDGWQVRGLTVVNPFAA
jgi:predicted nucleic acid-binding protein